MVLAEFSCDSTVNVHMASFIKFYSYIVFVCLKRSTLSHGGLLFHNTPKMKFGLLNIELLYKL